MREEILEPRFAREEILPRVTGVEAEGSLSPSALPSLSVLDSADPKSNSDKDGLKDMSLGEEASTSTGDEEIEGEAVSAIDVVVLAVSVEAVGVADTVVAATAVAATTATAAAAVAVGRGGGTAFGDGVGAGAV